MNRLWRYWLSHLFYDHGYAVNPEGTTCIVCGRHIDPENTEWVANGPPPDIDRTDTDTTYYSEPKWVDPTARAKWAEAADKVRIENTE